MAQRMLKVYKDFRGGWNADAAPDSLTDNELMLADNVDLDERGALNKRKGTKPLVNTSDTCPDQTGMTATQIKLAGSASEDDDYYNTWIIHIVSGTGAGQTRAITDYTGVTRVADINEEWETQPDNTSVYEIYVNYGAQVEKLIEWPRNDGTRILLAIIGTTLCKINDDGTKTEIITLDSPDIGYFFLQDKFYFTGKENETDNYWYYDGTEVKEVTPKDDETNDLAPIKRCRKFIWNPRSFRIHAALDMEDKAALYYSEPNDPTFFKQTSKLYPTTADGPVISLDLFGDALIVIYQGSIWAWTGSSPETDAEWKKIPVGQGTIATGSPALTPGSLTFLGQGGIFSISPGLLDYNVVLIAGDELVRNRTKDKVSSIIRSIAHPETAVGLFDKVNERYMLAYGDDADDTRNNKVLVLDWGMQSFTRYTGWHVNDFCQRANGNLLIATNGYILKAGQGYKDFDPEIGDFKAINFNVQLKQWNFDYPFHLKKNKKLFLASKQYDKETSSVVLTVKADYKTFDPLNIDLDESLVWGEKWGKVWGWNDLVTKEIKYNYKAQRFQIELSNNVIDEPVTIYGFAWEYTPKRPRGVKL